VAHPTWLVYGFAAVMAWVSGFCVVRLALATHLGRQTHYDVNLSHVLMGVAMIGMLVPRWNAIPNGLWEIVFAVVALYFLALSARFVAVHGMRGIDDDHVHHISHYLIHAVLACGMLYMYWLGMPITTMSGTDMSMSGPPHGAGDPGLTLLLIGILVASAIWQLETIGEFARQPGVAVGAIAGALGGDPGKATEGCDDRPWLAPRLEIGDHIAMCITMAYMLVLVV
jgi:hypothetical protein